MSIVADRPSDSMELNGNSHGFVLVLNEYQIYCQYWRHCNIISYSTQFPHSHFLTINLE